VFAGGVHLGGLSVQACASRQDCTRRIPAVKSVSVLSVPRSEISSNLTAFS
jgi:hypothetical protein